MGGGGGGGGGVRGEVAGSAAKSRVGANAMRASAKRASDGRSTGADGLPPWSRKSRAAPGVSPSSDRMLPDRAYELYRVDPSLGVVVVAVVADEAGVSPAARECLLLSAGAVAPRGIDDDDAERRLLLLALDGEDGEEREEEEEG